MAGSAAARTSAVPAGSLAIARLAIDVGQQSVATLAVGVETDDQRITHLAGQRVVMTVLQVAGIADEGGVAAAFWELGVEPWCQVDVGPVGHGPRDVEAEEAGRSGERGAVGPQDE